jgi:hypothetical protein
MAKPKTIDQTGLKKPPARADGFEQHQINLSPSGADYSPAAGTS